MDTGDVLAEQTFTINDNDTIVELQALANSAFPGMLLEVVEQISEDTLRPRRQEESEAAYYPLRFPDDGLIIWDMYTAEQVHNRIRALTEPYPCAFTFLNGVKVKLLRSKHSRRAFFGEPGRIYLRNRNGLLVCARDRCLWIQKGEVEETGQALTDVTHRYEKFVTLSDGVLEAHTRGQS